MVPLPFHGAVGRPLCFEPDFPAEVVDGLSLLVTILVIPGLLAVQQVASIISNAGQPFGLCLAAGKSFAVLPDLSNGCGRWFHQLLAVHR